LLQEGETIEDCEGDHKLWTKEGTVFKAHQVEIGTSNGIMTEITGGIKVGTEILTDFNISGGAADAEQQQANPFMPRPRNNNKQSGNGGGNAPQRK
jgi:HlyD family secretion protein